MIDELDIKITESTHKLTELRGSSLKLLMDCCDFGESVQNGEDEDIDQNGKERDNDQIRKNISFVSVEKEINNWQDHKNNLIDERNQIITNLNRMLVDQITSNSLIDYTTKNVCSQARNQVVVKANEIKMPSNSMKSSSIAPVSNICLSEVYAEEDSSW